MINHSLPIAAFCNLLTPDSLGYYPTYAGLSPHDRRCYLEWLAGGRREPNINIGFVFLFFAGIERRVLLSHAEGKPSLEELQQLLAEVQRLRQLYSSSRPFSKYADQFMDALELKLGVWGASSPLNVDSSELMMRVAMARASVRGQPMTAEGALCWMRHTQGGAFSKPVRTAWSQFRPHFGRSFQSHFPGGVPVSAVRATPLSVAYKPASASLQGDGAFLVVSDLESASFAPPTASALASIFHASALAVERAPAMEDWLPHPENTWPAALRERFSHVVTRVGNGLVAYRQKELQGQLSYRKAKKIDRGDALASLFESRGIGLELEGSGLERPIVLFALGADAPSPLTTEGYAEAAVAVDLACAVAMSDGAVSAPELRMVLRFIDGQTRLPQDLRNRLRARMKLGLLEALPLAAIRRRVTPLSKAARESICEMLTAMAAIDGTVSAEEDQVLDRFYGVMKVKRQKPKVAATLTLDRTRIVELQAESARVAELLSQVFEDVDDPVVVDTPPAEARVMGLDPVHTQFLRSLCSRSAWSRADLAVLASSLGLMVDGAIERVNEAAYDHLDGPLLEGDDPVELIPETLSKVPPDADPS